MQIITELPAINGLLLTLDQRQTGNWNEIDAVELIGVANNTVVKQWACYAEATSEYSSPNWSALQATGAPDTHRCGDIPTAWASKGSNTLEQLMLIYEQPVMPIQINIHQTYNPGAIVSVHMIPAHEDGLILIENSADPGTSCPGIFTLNLDPSYFADITLKIEQNSTSMPTNEQSAKWDATLTQAVQGLVSKGFSFLATTQTAQEFCRQVDEFDQKRTVLTQQVFNLLNSFGFGMSSETPEYLRLVSKHIIGFGTQDISDEDLGVLHETIKDWFPLCAITFARLHGPRFVPIINGDCLTQQEFVAVVNQFQLVNLALLEVGGRLQVKLFGMGLNVQGSSACGSLIVIASDTQRARQLGQWGKQLDLHSDTVWNQIKERATRWQFWAKAVFGILEYKPNQLRQEVIVIDAQTGLATTSAAGRIGLDFGFAIDEICGGLSD